MFVNCSMAFGMMSRHILSGCYSCCCCCRCFSGLNFRRRQQILWLMHLRDVAHQKLSLVKLLLAEGALEQDDLAVDLFQVVLEVDLRRVLLVAHVTRKLLQTLVHDLKCFNEIFCVSHSNRSFTQEDSVWLFCFSQAWLFCFCQAQLFCNINAIHFQIYNFIFRKLLLAVVHDLKCFNAIFDLSHSNASFTLEYLWLFCFCQAWLFCNINAIHF